MGRSMECAFALVAMQGGQGPAAWQLALEGLKATPLDQPEIAEAWVSLANCIGRIMNEVTVH